MLNFLKEMFLSDKEPEVEEVELNKLQNWFEEKISKVGFNEHAKDHFTRIKDIKEQIPELIKNLNSAEISKENKNVEDRIKNIVRGHKDNFSREIERFEESLEIIEKESFKTLQEYQEVIEYNAELDKKIEELAKRTAKSYQAAQHLFFKEVEALFKKTGELNTLIKEFEKTIKAFNIEDLLSIKAVIQELKNNINKKEDFSKEVIEKEKQEKETEKILVKERKLQDELKKSIEYKEYKDIEKNIGEIEKKIKDNDNNIFSYFSKLTKPLRKYERIAIDNKIIQDYIDNGLRSFWQDTELKVKDSLQGLKKSLQDNNIAFEEKQKNNFLDLIKKSENDYLEELRDIGQKLKKEREQLFKKLEGVEVILKIDEINKKINNNNERLSALQNRISELKSKQEKIDLNKIKQKIVEGINQRFKMRLKII